MPSVLSRSVWPTPICHRPAWSAAICWGIWRAAAELTWALILAAARQILPPARLERGHLLGNLACRGEDQRPRQLCRRIRRRAGMLARRHDHAAPRARVDVDVR